MNKLFTIILTVSLLGVITNDSHSDRYWAKTYAECARHDASSIQQTSDGEYIIAGVVEFSSEDIWVLKLDNSGNVSWEKSYGGSNDDSAHSIQQTTDGGFIVLGYTESFSAGKTDIWILKLDSDGNIAWQKVFGGSDWDSARSIRQTSDGGYIVAGSTYSFAFGDFWILKLHTNGDIEWQKTYGGSGGDVPSSIQQTTDGGYIVAGSTGSFGAGYVDIWVIKLDSNGDITWQKTFGGSNDDSAHSIQQTTDGGYILACSTLSLGAGNYDIWIFKLDSDGNISWQKTYGVNGNDSTRSIQQTTDGGYIVAGHTYNSNTGMNDFLVLKLDVDGNISWQKAYGGANGHSSARSIQQTTDGGYIVTGMTYSFGVSNKDMWVLKLNSNGEIHNCEIMGNSNVTVSTTNIIGHDTNVMPQVVTDTIINNTSITAYETSSTRLITCCYDDISDYDIDGIGDACDNCPNNSNPDQNDNDLDGFGDACDSDDDNDGICDPGELDQDCTGSDNCPEIQNGPLGGTCTKGEIGSPCRSHSSCITKDASEYFCSLNQEDYDNDGVGDVCDNCPEDYNPGQEDIDNDGIGNVCDNCIVELIYGNHSDETEFLRSIRDNVLSQTPEGQELIKLYYEWSPVIVKAMEEDEEFKEKVKEMIDGILPMISGEL